MLFIKKFIVSLALVVIGVSAFIAYWAHQPLIEKEAAPIEFMIVPGSSLRSAMRQLRDAGLPTPPILMEIIVRSLGKSATIKAGSYALQPGSTPLDLVGAMVRGETIQEALTIIEGWSFGQMRAELVRNKWLKADSANLNEQEFLARVAPGYTHPEGIFYPDTYLFARGSSDLQLYAQAHARLIKKLEQAWVQRAPDLPYTSPYEALIMASIIEKETGQEAERKRVAAVFLNRLKLGMPLQTDPTVIYGMGQQFDGNLRKQDLQTDTAYNTYMRSGFPPTPISLPGSAAIEAALNPAPGKELYFVGRGDGSSHFSDNLSDHNNAVNKYQRSSK